MDADLGRMWDLVRGKRRPEDVFGVPDSSGDILAALKKVYRQMVRKLHPDRYSDPHDQETAGEAIRTLNELWETAQARIDAGTYGTDAGLVDPVTIAGKEYAYAVGDPLWSDGMSAFYRATYGDPVADALFRVSSASGNNTLLENEAKMLQSLGDTQNTELVQLLPYVPHLIESFRYREAGTRQVRQANVLAHVPGLNTLEEVMQAYPGGVPPKHVAWMWGRLLLALHVIHECGIVHGAVVPSNVTIHAEQHGLVLRNFAYAVRPKGKISVIDTAYESFYPPEVMKKGRPTPGLDIYMGAMCMIQLLGGDPVSQTYPATVPVEIQNFFNGCLFESVRMRPQDALALREEFHRVIERLWGPRTFLPFTMPTSSY